MWINVNLKRFHFWKKKKKIPTFIDVRKFPTQVEFFKKNKKKQKKLCFKYIFFFSLLFIYISNWRNVDINCKAIYGFQKKTFDAVFNYGLHLSRTERGTVWINFIIDAPQTYKATHWMNLLRFDMTQAPLIFHSSSHLWLTRLTFGLLLVQVCPRPVGSHAHLLSALPWKTNGQVVGVFPGWRFGCVFI